MAELIGALETFVQQCNHNQRLKEMNRDWDRRILLGCDDDGEQHWIESRAGALSCGLGPIAEPHLEIRAPHQTLYEIFSGQLSPTEPYNQGDLLVRGQQDDVLRLDILTLLIWGE
jgi:hypothetical protein